MKRALWVVAAAIFAAACITSVIAAQSEPQTGETPDQQANHPPPPPPLREVPGLTAPDPHPNGCVDCHTNMKQYNMDVRISTLMGQWTQGVEPKLLAAAKAAAADSNKITGKHPKLSDPGKDVPHRCLMCHGKSSTMAPPFARLLHLVHLVGGESNLYVSYYQADCTHCHKLNQTTGAWSIPSATEPAGD